MNIRKIKTSIKKGFTTVELMIVVVIFGILAAMAAPAMSDFFNSMSAQTRASSILAGLNKARASAIARNTSIIFLIADNGFWQYGCLNVNTDQTNGAYCPSDTLEQDSESTSAGDITIDLEPAGSNYVLFNSLGMSVKSEMAGDPLEKINISIGAKEYQIEVRNSGQAKLCEGTC